MYVEKRSWVCQDFLAFKKMTSSETASKSFFCYCLKSTVSNRTYVGASVNVNRRLRQHNGIISGGAKYTKSNRPWEIKIIASGFSTWREALQFEYRWKKTRVKSKGLTAFERREKCLQSLLQKKPWKDKTIEVKTQNFFYS